MGAEAQPARRRPSNFPLRTVHVQTEGKIPDSVRHLMSEATVAAFTDDASW